MNILIIHGDNVNESYKRFIDAGKKAKEKGWEIENTLNNVRAGSLFTEKRAFILYFDSKLTANSLKKFPKNAKIEEYKLPKSIFKFLESFYPGNTKEVLNTLHEIANKQPPEFIFALLARQVKNLYCVKIGSQGVALQNWQIARLKSQTNRFPNGLLEEIISVLAEIDIEVKTSRAELIYSLDLLIIRLLK